jgi:cell division protease FtsH
LPSSFFRRPRFFIPAGIALLALIAAGTYAMRHRSDTVPVLAYSEFLKQIDRGQVKEIRASADGALLLTLSSGATASTVAPATFLANEGADLARKGIHIELEPPEEPNAVSPVSIVIAGFFLILLGFTVYKTTAGRIHTPGRAKTNDREDQVVTFRDVAGVDEAKDEVKEIVDFLREPQRFSAIGGRIPKGVLLVGPPGTGKTLLARSMAGEAGVPFIFASGSDFVEMYAGVGAARVRRLFKGARRHKSCIVFIDELDAVGRSRGGSSLSHEEREQTLNQLLVEMDGFESTRGIVVIAATNRQDVLDPALLRPGRFDRQVTVGNPDLRGREAILGVHGRKVAMTDDVDLRSIARGTPGFSGADLANLVNEAALAAARAGRQKVTGKDMESARDKVLMGVERRSVTLSELDRVNCAYHEAGHAVVAALLPMADPVHKVTIIPRGRAMGVTMQLPEADRHTYTKGYLETQIAVLMGGRCAEELFMSHMTSGASNDIERATDVAQHMVCEWGMSAMGMRAFRKAGNNYEIDRPHAMSEATARRVDEEIEKILKNGYDRAHDILSRNRESVKAIAHALLDQEALEADEVRDLLARAGAQLYDRKSPRRWSWRSRPGFTAANVFRFQPAPLRSVSSAPDASSRPPDG